MVGHPIYFNTRCRLGKLSGLRNQALISLEGKKERNKVLSFTTRHTNTTQIRKAYIVYLKFCIVFA